MEWRKTVRTLAVRSLIVAAAVLVVILGWAAERFARGRDRELCQELIIQHFERSSWFAMNAEKYQDLDPELTRRFKEMAAWHAKRAREFQRMETSNVAREAERDLEHDKVEGRLMERAAKANSLLRKRKRKRSREAAEKAERDGGDARTLPPGFGPRPD
jgi:hypothetical protein